MKPLEFIKKHRFLLTVYGLATLIALLELTGDFYKDGEEPTLQLRREKILRNEERETIESTLYPESASAGYYRGRDYLFAQPPELDKARQEFEKAIRRGYKSHEMLLHHYAVTLVLLGEDEDEIETAIVNWRWNYPRSNIAPPRAFAAQLTASLRQSLQSRN